VNQLQFNNGNVASLRRIKGILWSFWFAVHLFATGPSHAINQQAPVVVNNDPGGNMAQRVSQIDVLRKTGTPVEIRGGCMSACTMYLGLRTTCVAPTATLGFHGPSSPYYGIALPQKEFDHWSMVMANHYPEPLRSWYLREGRNIIVGFHQISGRELIRLGVPQCA
jgi:hypothetical protein